ncbi:hypothetical protein ACO0LF_29800 [Undibacterium sp. Di27W]|uniref:hypothetical protein n=1 Tax=Undibacterium sp. Di27W TaxID=3413036 RepID=UPI003BF00D7A
MENVDKTLSDRLRLLIDAKADKRGKFAHLENLTSISSENWKSFYYNRQRPNVDMIEALAKLWPETAFWLATGITDAENGHIDPTDYKVKDMQVNGLDTGEMAERHFARREKRRLSVNIFRYKIKELELQKQQGNLDGEKADALQIELHDYYFNILKSERSKELNDLTLAKLNEKIVAKELVSDELLNPFDYKILVREMAKRKSSDDAYKNYELPKLPEIDLDSDIPF